MKKSNLFVVAAVAGVVIVGLIIGLLSMKPENKNETKNDTSTSTNNPTLNPSKPPISASNPAKTNGLIIRAGAIVPQYISIKAGTTVSWTNTDMTARTLITSDDSDSGIKSPALKLGEVYSLDFDKAGTYTYHLESNPSKIATIVVE